MTADSWFAARLADGRGQEKDSAHDDCRAAPAPAMTRRIRETIGRALGRMQPLFLLLGLIWAAHGLNIALGGALTPLLGLAPRRLDGLDGVVAMPFVHADLAHLIANTAPLAALGALILILTPRRFYAATAIVILGGGALLWCFGREYNHIGASGLLFGWFGYLVAAGLFERSMTAALGAVAALALYGGAILAGLTEAAPSPDQIVSLEAHALGLAAGFAAAWALRTPSRSRSRPIRRPRA